jgi:predicted ferric reductase
MANLPRETAVEDYDAIPLWAVLATFLAVIVGALLAVAVLPDWLPGLTASLLDENAQAFWFISRSTAFVGYVLMWLSMLFGLLISNKMARAWPGGLTAFEVHQYVSLLGLAFALFHALVLLGDEYIQYNLVQILLPFASEQYQPLWVGTGQLSFYVLGLVSFSFYIRKQIGRRSWQLIHFLSYASFILVLLHGLGSGTDSGSSWAMWIYWVSGGSVLFLTIYRILSAWMKPTRPLKQTS